MKDVLKVLSKNPNLEVMAAPSLVMDLGDIGKIGDAPTKFRGMQVTKMNKSFLMAGEFQDIKSKLTIPFHGDLKLNESLVGIEDGSVIIITLNRSLLKK